jgi:short-subunit dehydrogenase
MKRARRPIDVLVNNAGVLEHGPFVEHAQHAPPRADRPERHGLSEMLAQFLPPMVARGQGRVLNVASIAAFQPVPLLATYAATKAYVLSLTESLSEELQGTGVTDHHLCPGITATSMLDQAQAAQCRTGDLPGWWSAAPIGGR